MWEMENETKTFHIPFFTATEKSKMENGCPFSIFHFPSAVENEINGMYTDLTADDISIWIKFGTPLRCEMPKAVMWLTSNTEVVAIVDNRWTSYLRRE